VINIDKERAIDLSEALKLNTSLTSLDLSSNRPVASFQFSLNTDDSIDDEGALQLSEALKLNTSLTSLNLSCNRLVLLHFILTKYR
jgi:hypothetical protein